MTERYTNDSAITIPFSTGFFTEKPKDGKPLTAKRPARKRTMAAPAEAPTDGGEPAIVKMIQQPR